MRKRPSIASEYLVRVSCPCIASVYLVSVSRPCQHSRPYIRHFFTLHSSFFTPRPSFTPHPSDFDGLETAPSAPSGINVARGVARGVARDVARDVARGVARDVVRNVVRGVSRNVSRGVGRLRQYEHLTGACSPPLFYISHNLSVEMGNFTDKLLTLNHLSVRTSLFTDKPVFLESTPVRTMRVCQ